MVKRFQFANRQDAFEFADALLNEQGVFAVELGGDGEIGTVAVDCDREPPHAEFLLRVYGGKEQA